MLEHVGKHSGGDASARLTVIPQVEPAAADHQLGLDGAAAARHCVGSTGIEHLHEPKGKRV